MKLIDLPQPQASGTRDERPPRSVTLRTVAECEPASIVEALALARSLRAFGGSHAEAPCEVHFVERLPDDPGAFEELGVKLVPVDRFDERCPHANKLRVHYPVETDYLLAVDCDVVVAGDFSRFLTGEAVASAVDWGDWMVPGGWEKLFDAAGIPFPAERMLTTRLWQETVHYPNSGVLVVPQRHIEALHAEWSKRVRELLEAAERRDWWGNKQHYFADQISLALANHSGAFPSRVLPIEMNWLLKFDDLPAELAPERRRPLLLHSIHRMDFESGHLLPHRYPLVEEAIRRYNALLEPVAEEQLEEALRRFETSDRGW